MTYESVILEELNQPPMRVLLGDHEQLPPEEFLPKKRCGPVVMIDTKQIKISQLKVPDMKNFKNLSCQKL